MANRQVISFDFHYIYGKWNLDYKNGLIVIHRTFGRGVDPMQQCSVHIWFER